MMARQKIPPISIDWRDDGDSLILAFIYVDSPYRNKGIAAKIISRMERLAKRSGRDFVVETVLSEKLMAMLERRGYKKRSSTLARAPLMVMRFGREECRKRKIRKRKSVS